MGYLGYKPADKPLTAADITDSIITSAKIVDGTIVNADINASAAIASTKLSGISSDFVKLGSTTPSDANTISIDGYFTSDYDIYKIYMLGLSGTSMSNTRFSYRVNVSGTAQTGSNYYWSTFAGPMGTWTAYFNSTAGSYVDLGYVHNSNLSTAHSNLEMTIYRPLDTDKTTIMTDMLAWDNGVEFARFFGGSAYNSATAISGVTFGVGNFGTGNIQVSRAIVYGLKL
jgi:hypothetical protein